MADDTGASRPKRLSKNKAQKFEHLARLRESIKSGKKHKYEIGEVDNVYEEVDEREYSKKVLERQEEDWIVDDDGGGYIEDGREIFDDDLDEDSINLSKNSKPSKKRGRSQIGESSDGKERGGIRNMLVNMPAKKKKEAHVKLDEDDILGDIISELETKPSEKSVELRKTQELSAKDYLRSFSASRPRPIKPPLTEKVINSVVPTPKEEPPVVAETIKIKEEPMDIEEYPSIMENFDDCDFSEMQLDVSTKENIEVKKEPIEVAPIVEAPAPQISLPETDDKGFWGESVSQDRAPPVSVNIDKSTLPLIKNDEGKDVLRLYYWDAHEEAFSSHGTVYIFGKVWVESVKSFVSCCVTVKNISRQIFLLPRARRVDQKTKEEYGDLLTMSDVYEEFNSKICAQYKVKEFKSKPTTKKYAFGKEGVPLESEYLEVRYASSFSALPADLEGETFSRVFGTTSSFLELLLLERGIKGPGWIDIMNPEPSAVSISWCKVEVVCNRPADLKPIKNVSEIPPLVILTILPQALYNQKSKESEIVSIGCLVSTSFPVDKPPPERLFNQHFCILSKPSNVVWPFDIREKISKFQKTHVEKMESERALLNLFITKLFRIDPDIIVGHDLSGYAVSLILERMNHHKVPNWSRIGRLKRSSLPHTKSKQLIERICLSGRLLCDIKVSAKELIRSRSYDLNSLCVNVLHFDVHKRPDMTEDDFRMCYGFSDKLVGAVWYLMSDASYILRIMSEMNVLPLALQITNIAGNVMSRTLMGGRSERNEFLLLHSFYNKGFIVPNKEYRKGNAKVDDEEPGNEEPKKNSRKKPQYAGGLVLDPKVGFYDDLILLMDFNSLYPSIIQEYNICFTTIPMASLPDDMLPDDYFSFLPDDTKEAGVLPTEIRKLVESRRDVKRLLKSPSLTPEMRSQYDIRQMALKLTANSMYGCLGFAMSRFYAKPLAAIVTAKGREILLNTKKIVESFNYEVIYGDTDSLMINTKTKDIEQVNGIGKKLKTEVNKSYRQVELDIDGIFKFMLLLKKKKYAAVTINKGPNGEVVLKQEMKGLDIVRRDWCQLSAEVGSFVLKQILNDHSADDRVENIHSYLENIRGDLETGKVPMSLLTVTKQLNKNPEDYNDSKGLPHVQVALRMNKTTSKHLKSGDTVPYIVCEDGTNNPPTQRAYHIEELKTNEKLKVDTNYYLSQQIHPVIARLCDPIEGTDAASIARCLGLDPSLYARRNELLGEDNEETLLVKNYEERFKDCSRFSFTCKGCCQENIIEAPLRKKANGFEELCLDHCVNPSCQLRPIDYLPSIQNRLSTTLRELSHKYAVGWLLCEDPVCNYRTTRVSNTFEGAYPLCPKCEHSVMHREMTSFHLYNQMYFFSHIFDLSKLNDKKYKFEPEIYAAYRKLYDQVGEVLKQSKYSMVDLSKVFSGLFPFKNPVK